MIIRFADLRPHFDSAPDPRTRRGRWYSLTAILVVCSCAVVSGARSTDELAEWGGDGRVHLAVVPDGAVHAWFAVGAYAMKL
ncbi:transposase family protein [Streptomyces sp. NPDC001833]|uniref:transposase family protein n=1 Tax=Streptomyces sp. NPDC001833 TaxID=3154658 RepID=UPI00331C20DF